MLTLLAIVPHPDDESALCAGLLQRAMGKGAEVTVVYITSGAHGRTLGLVESEDLPAERRRETHLAMSALGVGDVHFLDYKDYDPRKKKIHPWPDAKARLRACAKKISPRTVVIGFPPNGMNGHPDHVRASALASEIAEEAGAGLLFATTPEAERSLGATTYMEAEQRQALHLTPSHVLNMSAAELEKKIWALSCYRTQAVSMVDYMRHAQGKLGREYFSLARGTPQTRRFLTTTLKLSAKR